MSLSGMTLPLLSLYVTDSVVDPPTAIVADVGEIDIELVEAPLAGLRDFPKAGVLGAARREALVSLQADAISNMGTTAARQRDARERMVVS
jgi:hypothetical protein